MNSGEKNSLFKVPNFKSTFPWKINEFGKLPQINEWNQQLFDFSLMSEKELAKVRAVGSMAALLWPFCDDIGRYELLYKALLHAFISDDHTDILANGIKRGSQRIDLIWNQMDSVLDKLCGKEFVNISSFKACVVLGFIVFEPIYQSYNQDQKMRLTKGYKIACEGQRNENELFRSGYQIKSFDEYLELRIKNSGTLAFIALIEYSENITITEEEWCDPLMQRLFNIIEKIILYTNDVYSFEKEYIEGNCKVETMCYNAVSVTVKLDKCGIEEAMDVNITRLSKLEEEAHSVIQKILSKPLIRDQVKLFVDRICYVLGGNYYASISAPRYNKPGALN